MLLKIPPHLQKANVLQIRLHILFRIASDEDVGVNIFYSGHTSPQQMIECGFKCDIILSQKIAICTHTSETIALI